MSLICSYLQYLLPSFSLDTLEKMFLLNKSVYRNQLNLLTPRSKIFLRRDLAHVKKNFFIFYEKISQLQESTKR